VRRFHQPACALWIAAAMAATGAQAQTMSFAAGQSYSAGTSPTSVASGTFRLTGQVTLGGADLAITNQHGVAILFSDQHGGYLPRVDYDFPAGSNPQWVAAFSTGASLVQNLAVVNQGTGTVTIMLGSSDGTFTMGQSYPAGTNPRMVVVSDFNSDGAADLAVVDSGAGPGTSGVSVLMGNNDGTFQAAKFSPTGSVSLGLVAAYFDSDIYPDIAVANSGSDDISLLIGKGDGTFQPAVNYKLDRPGISVSPTSLTWVPLNGKNGLVAATPNVRGYAVLLEQTVGGVVSFGAPVYYTLDDPNFVDNKTFITTLQEGPGHLNAGLILADLSANHVTVLFGDGDGTFPTSLSYAAGPSPTCVTYVSNGNFANPYSLAVSNFAVDGVVTVVPMNAGGTLQAPPLYRSAFTPQYLAVGDLNNDGALDVVAASSFTTANLGSGVSMLADGKGGFQPPATWATSVTTSVALGDFNGDGRLDLVSTHPSPGNGNVSVRLGNGDGTFQAEVLYNAGTTPDTVAVADLNGDGKLDLVLGNHNSNNVSVLLGNGNGTFQPAIDYPTPSNGTPDSVVVTDFDGDGKPDIVAAISGINATTAALLLGNGDGTFQQAIPLPAGFHSSATLQVAAADFNGDGNSDLALTDGTTLSVILGNRLFTGQVPEPEALPAPVTTTLIGPGAAINGTVVVGDFNGDARLDLAVTNRDGIFLLAGNGDGSFQAPVTYTPFIGGAIAVGDFDGNGTPDLVAADSTQDQTPTDTVALMLNSKASTPISLTVATTPSGLAFSVLHGTTRASASSSNCAASPCTYTAKWGDFFQIVMPPIPSDAVTRTIFQSINDEGPTTIAADGQVTHTVLVPAVSTTVTVTYDRQYQLTLGFTPPLGGAVAAPPSGGFYSGIQYLTAVARAGWKFVNWTGIEQTSAGPVNKTCNANPCGAPVDGPAAWTANFVFVGQVCDPNGDKQLTESDLQELIRQALGVDPPTGDVDNDGGVNIVDLQISVNAARGGKCPVLVAPPLDWAGDFRQGAFLYDPPTGQAYAALSNGDGTFSYVPSSFAAGFDTLRSGDFNGDGGADIVLYNSTSGAGSLGLGNGDGTFRLQNLGWPAGFNFVAACDLNGDGKTDFVLYNSATGLMDTAISNGNGTFSYNSVVLDKGFSFFQAADFTGDGKADLLFYQATDSSSLAFIAIGDGAGGFALMPSPIAFLPGENDVIGDLNGDRKADFISYFSNNGVVDSFIGDGSGGFAGAYQQFPSGLTTVLLADFTGDRKVDVFAYNSTTGAAYFGTGVGDGTFNLQQFSWFSPGFDRVVTADVNGDGLMDLILYNSSTGVEYTGISQGDGTFSYTYQNWGTGKLLAR